MDHLKALLIKAGMTFVALWLVLNLGFNVSFMNIVWITLILGAVSYVMGDLYIYPKKGNMLATMSDLAMTFVVIWLLVMTFSGMSVGISALAAVIAAVVISLGEYAFHFYIKRKRLAANDKLRATYTH